MGGMSNATGDSVF